MHKGLKQVLMFQVMGGDPLLKLIAVDWFKGETIMDEIALNPRYLVQV